MRRGTQRKKKICETQRNNSAKLSEKINPIFTQSCAEKNAQRHAEKEKKSAKLRENSTKLCEKKITNHF
jgi:hypothetical protein